MKVLLGQEGGQERVILCGALFPTLGFYLAVRLWGEYTRLAMGSTFGLHVSRG